jgi:hypothetical protein
MRLEPHVFLVLGMVVPLLVFSGAASADEAKCVNTVNKWAARVAVTQASENARCIKEGGRGDPIPIELCITSDGTGKVGKAADKLNEKVSQDCQGSTPTVPPIDISDPNALSRIMIDRGLTLIHGIFSTDLDAVIVGAVQDKSGWKCQSAVAKAVRKCQDAKLATYNRCQKDQLRTGAGSVQALQDACLGANGTGESIPDTKGKIGKRCGNGLSVTLGKKCGTTDNQALFPSWDPNRSTLAEFIDQEIACELCEALNALDGLSRCCEEFDDGTINASCGLCGNDVVDEGEECDGAGDPVCPGECQADCTCLYCGDGEVNRPSEDCDTPDDSACPGECKLDCTCPHCGDNVVNQPSEQCDGSDDATCPGECRLDCSCSLGGQCPADGSDTGCRTYLTKPLCNFCCVAGSDACAGCWWAQGSQCLDPYNNALCDEELNRAGCGGVCCP